MKKDYDAVKKLANEMKPKERDLALFLGKLMSEMHHGFEVRKTKNEYEGWDLDLYFNDRNQEKFLLKIEAECGVTLHNWKNTIPANWHRGLSVPERKITDYKTGALSKKSDMYIKHNLDFTSLFAIDTDWLVQQVANKTIPCTVSNHSLAFKTNNTFLGVPKNFAKQFPNHVCISENSDFKEFKQFVLGLCARNFKQ